ncbi:MAG: hypothetical protein OEY28_06395, partial [Nitrospira sp.]|nr:hypothetical protein [Nitrospira sp.]
KSSLGDDSADISASEDASFMSDFAVSTMEGIHADVDEVDPLSEADVYLAYGRYKQAEELINDALAKENKPDLQMKLLEVLHAAKDKDGFQAKAQAFKGSLSKDPDMWSQVCHWGADMSPENPLFSGAGGGGGDDTMAEFGDFDLGDVDDSGGGSDTFDLDMDLGLGGNDDIAMEADAGGSLDFDLDSFDSEAAASPADDDATMAFNMDSAPESEADDGGLDFNLDMDTTAESSVADDGGMDFNLDAGDSMAAADDGGLDFNLDMDTGGDSGLDMGSDSLDAGLSMDDGAEDMTMAGGDLDFNLDDGDALSDSGDMDLDMSLDSGGDGNNVVDFNAAASASGDETMAFSLDEDFDADIDDSLFADVDEVGTKLDLAKAYIDMGDSDGAKSILDEVVEEGDATQKEEAKELMRQIG